MAGGQRRSLDAELGTPSLPLIFPVESAPHLVTRTPYSFLPSPEHVFESLHPLASRSSISHGPSPITLHSPGSEDSGADDSDSNYGLSDLSPIPTHPTPLLSSGSSPSLDPTPPFHVRLVRDEFVSQSGALSDEDDGVPLEDEERQQYHMGPLATHLAPPPPITVTSTAIARGGSPVDPGTSISPPPRLRLQESSVLRRSSLSSELLDSRSPLRAPVPLRRQSVDVHDLRHLVFARLAPDAVREATTLQSGAVSPFPVELLGSLQPQGASRPLWRGSRPSTPVPMISGDSKASTTPARPHAFSGREWVFAMVEAWRTAASHEDIGGVLLITGEPGAGKTALLAELLHRHRWRPNGAGGPQGVVVAHHSCDRTRIETIDPAIFIQALAKQLAAAFHTFREWYRGPGAAELTGRRVRADPRGSLERGILAKLRLMQSEMQPEVDRLSGPLLLVIDALDDSLAWEGGPTNLLEVIESVAVGRLPRWLRIVTSARSRARVHNELDLAISSELFIGAEGERSHEDIESYAHLCLSSSLVLQPAFRGHPEVLQLLVLLIRDRAAGNFVYVQQAVKFLERRVLKANGSIDLEVELRSFPENVNDLYVFLFNKHFPDDESFVETRRVLEVLVAAREPLPAHLLARASHVAASALPGLLSKLCGDHGRPRASQRVALLQRSLTEWLTEGATADRFHIKAKSGHASLAQVGWKEAVAEEEEGINAEAMSEYFVRHLSQHLMEAFRPRDAVTLLFDYGFLRSFASLVGPSSLLHEFKRLKRMQMPLSGEECIIPAAWWSDVIRVCEALEATRPILWQDVRQLGGQLLIHLNTDDPSASPRLRALLQDADGPKTHPWLRPLRRSLMGGILHLECPGDLTSTVRFTPCGHFVLCGGSDPEVRIFELKTGLEVGTLEGHEEDIMCLDVSPGGELIASGSRDCTVLIHDFASRKLIHRLKGHNWVVSCVRFTPDGTRVVSGSWDAEILVWRVATGTLLRTMFSQAAKSVSSLDVCSRSLFAITGSKDGMIRAWNMRKGTEAGYVPAHTLQVTSLRAFDDTTLRTVSGSEDGTVALCCLDTGTLLGRFGGHTDWVQAVARSPKGDVFTGSADKKVRVFKEGTKTGQLLWSFDRPITCLDVTNDGTRVACGVGNTVHIFPVNVKRPMGHASAVMGCICLPNGTVVTGGRKLMVWSPSGQRVLKTLSNPHTRQITDLACSNDNLIISSSRDKNVAITDISTGSQNSRMLTGHRDFVMCVAVTSGRIIASGSRDSTVRLWSLDKGKDIVELRDSNAYIDAVTVNDAGSVMAGTRSGTIAIWSLENQSLWAELKGQSDDWVLAVVSLPNGRLAAGYMKEGTVKLWNIEKQAAVWSVDVGAGRAIRCLCGTPDGAFVVAGGDDCRISVLHVDDGSLVACFSLPTPVLSLCCSRDVTYPNILTAGDAEGGVHFFELVQRDAWPLSPLSVIEGSLHVKEGFRWRSRYCILSLGSLHMVEDNEDESTHVRSFHLREVVGVSPTSALGKTHCLSIMFGGSGTEKRQPLLVAADTAEELERWTSAIHQAAHPQ